MYRNKRELLADIILGEAVLKLLLDGDAITSATLLNALTFMAEGEKDLQRHQACLMAISHACSSKKDRAGVAGRHADAASGELSSIVTAGKRQKQGWRSGQLTSSVKWH